MSVTVNSFVLNVLSFTLCPEHTRIGSSTLSVINGPTTIAPDLAIFVFLRNCTCDDHNGGFMSDN
jgi:hypothetical protein